MKTLIFISYLACLPIWVQADPPSPEQIEKLIPKLKKKFIAEGIPAHWVRIAEVESSLDPQAQSPKGAKGLFQLMPDTAARFGLKTDEPDERLDCEKSARAAARYLKFLHGLFKSWPLALAAYNAGEGYVERLLEEHHASSFEEIADHLPSETRNYVQKVLSTVQRREQIHDSSVSPFRPSQLLIVFLELSSYNELLKKQWHDVIHFIRRILKEAIPLA